MFSLRVAIVSTVFLAAAFASLLASTACTFAASEAFAVNWAPGTPATLDISALITGTAFLNSSTRLFVRTMVTSWPVSALTADTVFVGTV